VSWSAADDRDADVDAVLGALKFAAAELAPRSTAGG